MRWLVAFFLHLGPAGLLLLGIADSSFLFLPFGNDFLLVALVARNHRMFLVDVPMAALGSAIGVFLLDAVCRKGGEEGLKRMLPAKRYKYLKKRMAERAGWVVAMACLAPPPFPFTAVIAAASASQFSRKKLLAIAFCMRAVRFSLVGIAAILLGRHVLRIAQSPAFYWAMIAFIALCVVGSAISVTGWIRRSRGSRA